MATFLAEHRVSILTLFFLSMFFIWMDISLYFKVQKLKANELKMTSHGLFQTSVNNIPEMDGSLTNSKSGIDHLESSSRTTDLTTESVTLFDPFKGLSIKMMMMDQPNNYIFTPLAEIFNEVTNFSTNFFFITPNLISACGVLWAMLAAKLVTYDSLCIHRLSVFFFQIRTFFDALDGIVARDHLGIKQHISLSNTSGYLVDGFADSIGFGAYLLGCYYYLRRNLPKFRLNKHQYLPVQQVHDGYINNGKTTHSSSFVITQLMPPKLLWTTRQVFFVVLCFALQLVISCLCWNRYIEAYHVLLESPPVSSQHANLQNQILKSSIMWVIMWFWRISNAQSLMQFLLISVFVNRLWDFLSWIQYIGFFQIIILSFLSEVHLNHVSSVLSYY